MKVLAKKWRGPYGVLSDFRASEKHGRLSIEAIRRKDAAAVSEEDETDMGARGAARSGQEETTNGRAEGLRSSEGEKDGGGA